MRAFWLCFLLFVVGCSSGMRAGYVPGREYFVSELGRPAVVVCWTGPLDGELRRPCFIYAEPIELELADLDECITPPLFPELGDQLCGVTSTGRTVLIPVQESAECTVTGESWIFADWSLSECRSLARMEEWVHDVCFIPEPYESGAWRMDSNNPKGLCVMHSHEFTVCIGFSEQRCDAAASTVAEAMRILEKRGNRGRIRMPRQRNPIRELEQ